MSDYDRSIITGGTIGPQSLRAFASLGNYRHPSLNRTPGLILEL